MRLVPVFPPQQSKRWLFLQIVYHHRIDSISRPARMSLIIPHGLQQRCQQLEVIDCSISSVPPLRVWMKRRVTRRSMISSPKPKSICHQSTSRRLVRDNAPVLSAVTALRRT
jgi:hypothetical protein